MHLSVIDDIHELLTEIKDRVLEEVKRSTLIFKTNKLKNAKLKLVSEKKKLKTS